MTATLSGWISILPQMIYLMLFADALSDQIINELPW